jgi:glucan-binding YG repeat protein
MKEEWYNINGRWYHIVFQEGNKTYLDGTII